MNAGKITILIPAAGASRRLGRPKQLEIVAGKTLLRAAAERALASKVGPVLIVLGSHEPECRAELQDLPVQTLTAPDWQEGMGATLRAGVAAAHTSAGILITLVDQHQLTPADLTTLATAWRNTSLPICAAAYANTLGPPALFACTEFPNLLALTGDQGARRLLRAAPHTVLSLPMPHAEADLDTPP